MPYCSVDDVLHEFTPSLKKNMERDYGDELDAVIEGHILKANAFLHASLARAYSVPLKSPTSIVITAECKIAAYFAAIAYSEKDEVVKDKYETALMILDSLVDADNPALVDDDYQPDSSLNASRVLYGSDDKIFTAQELALW